MQTQELEWDKGMVVQYGVDVIVPEHARLEIPLHHSRELCARPGGLAIRQLPEFIQFQYDTIRQEQAQEIEHFSVEEQHVFGSHLVPCLHLEYLTADPYQGLADTIHQIGKPYCDWRLEIGGLPGVHGHGSVVGVGRRKLRGASTPKAPGRTKSVPYLRRQKYVAHCWSHRYEKYSDCS